MLLQQLLCLHWLAVFLLLWLLRLHLEWLQPLPRQHAAAAAAVVVVAVALAQPLVLLPRCYCPVAARLCARGSPAASPCCQLLQRQVRPRWLQQHAWM